MSEKSELANLRRWSHHSPALNIKNKKNTQNQGFSKHEATYGNIQPMFRLTFNMSSSFAMTQTRLGALQVKPLGPEGHLVPEEPV